LKISPIFLRTLLHFFPLFNQWLAARLRIAGEHGAGYSELAELVRAASASDWIAFPGAISPAEKIDLLRRCKVYLQPSRHRGFGPAILEAMGCAAAVVTSPVGAVPEVVGDTAQFVDGTAPEAIAAGVNHLPARPDVRLDLGARALARAETLFSYERRKAALRQIIEQVSASPARSAEC
jgi:glycosyltransferase involved in cell wall biosynthesis